MANYIGRMRSNYFKVVDKQKFEKFCRQYDLEVITEDAQAKPAKRRYGFMADGSIPTGRCNAKGDWIETDFLKELSRHLGQSEVAVVMEVGSEKMRYLIGYACAVTWKGERIQLALSDIYGKAKETFGVEPTVAEY